MNDRRQTGQSGPNDPYQQGLEHFERGEWQAAVNALQALQARGELPPQAADMLNDAQYKLLHVGLEKPAAKAPPRRMLLLWAPLAGVLGLLLLVSIFRYSTAHRDPVPVAVASASMAASPLASANAPSASGMPNATTSAPGSVLVSMDAALAEARRDAPALNFQVISADGTTIASGSIGQPAVPVEPGTYFLHVDDANAVDTVFSVVSEQTVEIRWRQGYTGLVADVQPVDNGPGGIVEAPSQPTPGPAPGATEPTAELFVPTPEQGVPVATDEVVPPPYEIVPAPDEAAPAPTDEPAASSQPEPTARPVAMIEGDTTWTLAQSPIVIDRYTVVAQGVVLDIEAGVEVHLAPDVTLDVDGQLYAHGTDTTPVRFVGQDGRWSAINGRPGSEITLEYTELRNAGQNGTALTSLTGTLTLHNVVLTESGGGIRTKDSVLDIQDSQISGNDLLMLPAIEVQAGAAPTHMQGNSLGGNQMLPGLPVVRIVAGENASGQLNIEANSFTDQNASLLEIQTRSPIGGVIRCNAFNSGTIGLHLRSATQNADGFTLTVDNNAFEAQSSYGAASTIALVASNNWWGDPSGPSDPERNPAGRGVRASVNVEFLPPLAAPDACVPQQP